MARARKGAARRRTHRRVLKAAKGYRGGRSKLYRTAKESVIRAEAHAYRDRRRRKRDFRRLWTVRINAAARERGLNYGRFMHGLRESGVELDRKALADLAVAEPALFDSLVEKARSALS